MLQKRERLAKNRQARNQLGQLVTSKRLSLTGRVLPGDKTAEVKAGPPAKYFAFARVCRISRGGGGGRGAGTGFREHERENRTFLAICRLSSFSGELHPTNEVQMVVAQQYVQRVLGMMRCAHT